MLARTMPEFAITEAEALELAKAWCQWRSHYPGVMDPKTRDLLTLLGVVATVEGPRLMRASGRKAAERSARKTSEAAQKAAGPVPNVVRFDMPGV